MDYEKTTKQILGAVGTTYHMRLVTELRAKTAESGNLSNNERERTYEMLCGYQKTLYYETRKMHLDEVPL
jgi:hypothetical protein